MPTKIWEFRTRSAQMGRSEMPILQEMRRRMERSKENHTKKQRKERKKRRKNGKSKEKNGESKERHEKAKKIKRTKGKAPFNPIYTSKLQTSTHVAESMVAESMAATHQVQGDKNRETPYTKLALEALVFTTPKIRIRQKVI